LSTALSAFFVRGKLEFPSEAILNSNRTALKTIAWGLLATLTHVSLLEAVRRFFAADSGDEGRSAGLRLATELPHQFASSACSMIVGEEERIGCVSAERKSA
jgi:hypothetical protein